MLPYYMHTISPYLRDKTRLFLLHSGKGFGERKEEDHLISRLDGYVGATLRPEPYEAHQSHLDRFFPELDREKTEDKVVTDMILRDHFRHNRSIEERYRTNKSTYHDILKLYDGSTRFHHSISRGLERHVVDSINLLDNEVINRMTIVPKVSF